MQVVFKKCRVPIVRSQELADKMSALYLDLGDVQASKEGQLLRLDFNTAVLADIIAFSSKTGLHSHVDFRRAVIGTDAVTFPASPDFSIALNKKRIPHTGPCEIS